MKRRGLLNKHFCKNKFKYLQQDSKNWQFLLFSIMGSLSYHSNQSPYPIKTNYSFPLPVDGVCVMRTIGPAVSEKKIFEIVDDDGRTTDRQTDAGAWVYYKLTYEPSAQVNEPSAQVS